MLLIGLFLGLIAGFAAGGRLDNLLAIRFRGTLLIFIAVVIRLGTEAALVRGVELADQLRVPLLAAAYGLLAAVLWANRSRPGIGLALVGTLLNAFAILVNAGHMPVWDQALAAAGMTPADILSPLHFLVSVDPLSEFLLRAGPLGDILPVPLPFLRNVLSIGDVLLATGLGFFVFASLLREPERDGAAAGRPSASSVVASPVVVAAGPAVGHRVRPGTGLTGEPSIALERPLVLGGSGAGIATPRLTSAVAPEAALSPARPGLVARALEHPYVRLAQNGSFGALWMGQLVSLFGDRLHQLALVALVGEATQYGAFAVAMVFFAATVPNLVFGPFAGVLVDRWDQKRVMVGSDLVRAVVVLFIPAAASANVILVYPLVFLLTTVSIFFRPARTAVIPRVVKEDELVAANSAIWLGDSLADVIGYPVAAIFVAALGGTLALAFWVDALTYLTSAALVVTMIIPPVVHRMEETVPGLRGLRDDLLAGWRFLRGQPVLLANTVQAVICQFSIGVTIGIMAIYASEAITSGAIDERARYGFIEMAIGVGNLLGGFLIGLVGTRIAKGRTVIVGYVVYGVCVAALGLTGNLGVALALTMGMGVANMVFVIPTQALFMELTPSDMIGRVIAFRFSAVFGSMTIAMAVGGLMSDAIGPAAVFGIFGVVTVIGGLAGLWSRPLREA